jgi:protein SHQ1
MIIPRFRLSQDPSTVHIHILIKYAKIKDIDIEVQESTFWFYLKPYHLNLTFPGKLKSDAREKLTYDVSRSEIEVTLGKETPGEHFPDLDLIAKLLQPASNPTTKHTNIEELSEGGLQEDSVLQSGYGFNRKEKGLFNNRVDEMNDLFDIDPENTDSSARKIITENLENSDWSLDRYFEDLDAEVQLFDFFELFREYIPSITERMEDLSLSDLVKLSNKSVILSAELVCSTFLMTVDLVFSFCYEMTAIGEITCETAATINKLSPTLCCMIEFENVSDLCRKCFRRCLAYGFIRNLEVVMQAWEHMKAVFREGRGCVVRVLLKIKHVFERAEPKYLLNRLFVDDLIVWVQKTEKYEEFLSELYETPASTIEQLGLNFSFNIEETNNTT